MFTGIIEDVGKIKRIEKDGTNLDFWIESSFTNELKIDQSVAHNGVCLTVVEVNGNQYKVTIIKESIDRSNLGELQIDNLINLERCMILNQRIDGHLVQGHVDEIGTIKSIKDENGSYVLYIEYDKNSKNITVEKGSICVNGVSLTVVNSEPNQFSVAIIPYTWEHTNLGQLKVGNKVNLEFDIVGKYLTKLYQKQND